MHIPDGFLNAETWVTLAATSTIAVGWASRKAESQLDDARVPLMGVAAAFIFAAQMFNFPVAGGTSGHFMGGVLAAILLGPSAGMLIMTAVLLVQSLVFQDGGLTALGANIFNMGLIGSIGGYALFMGLLRVLNGRRDVAAFAAAWGSIVLAAVAAAVELSISGMMPLGLALPAMAGVHALIGVGEGVITVAALRFLAQTRPDLLSISRIRSQET